jgi:hypothetical protein
MSPRRLGHRAIATEVGEAARGGIVTGVRAAEGDEEIVVPAEEAATEAATIRIETDDLGATSKVISEVTGYQSDVFHWLPVTGYW